MAVSILDGTGSGFEAAVTSEGRLKVDLGGDITISGVNIDSVVIQETNPIDDNKNNPAWNFIYMTSGTNEGITLGSSIGSIVQTIDTGSFVQVISYSNNNIVNIGSWS